MIYFKRYNRNGELRETIITKEEYESYKSKSFRVDGTQVNLGCAPNTAEDYEELFFGKDYLDSAIDVSNLDKTYRGLLRTNGLLDKKGVLYKCPMCYHHELYQYLQLKDIDTDGILRVNIGAAFDDYCNISSYDCKDVILTTPQVQAMHNIVTQGCSSCLEDFIYERKLYRMGFQCNEDINLARENANVMKNALGSLFNLPASYFLFGRNNSDGEELY